MISKVKRCKRCIMDTSDSKIKFDNNGICDHCQSYDKFISPYWKPGQENTDQLMKIASKIRNSGKNKDYDCIIGMSGGTDSSYLIYVAVEVMKLRPLIYTVDTGWNLNVAVENIEKIVKKLNLDLYTEVIDWDEMRDLQLSFIKSGVPYQDLPQDHLIFAGLYNYAVKNKIKYVLTGSNNSTECIRPPVEWVHFNDIKLIKSIHKKYGKLKELKNLPFCSMFKYKVYYQYMLRMKRVAPLDLINFNKDEAEELLKRRYGWQKYENKHYENIFTRFYEGYYLIEKFGYDKRKPHYSNLIITNQMSKETALKLLNETPYESKMMNADISYIAKKLDITVNELKEYIAGPNKTYKDYPNSYLLIKMFILISKLFGLEKRNFR